MAHQRTQAPTRSTFWSNTIYWRSLWFHSGYRFAFFQVLSNFKLISHVGKGKQDLFDQAPDREVMEKVLDGETINLPAMQDSPGKVAGLLLIFLKQLTVPLIPFTYHDSFVAAFRASAFCCNLHFIKDNKMLIIHPKQRFTTSRNVKRLSSYWPPICHPSTSKFSVYSLDSWRSTSTAFQLTHPQNCFPYRNLSDDVHQYWHSFLSVRRLAVQFFGLPVMEMS